MRFIKKTALVRAERVPIENNKAGMFQHGKIVGLFMSVGFQKFKVTHEKGYELFLPDRKLIAHPGDWIVFDNGDCEIYTNERFQKCFEPG